MTRQILEIKPRIERGAPDSLFVSKLARVTLETAISENGIARNNDSFKRSIELALAKGGRSNYIQICAPFELYALARICKPQHIVEVGVSAGVSSAYLLLGLQLNGQGILHSIDLPEIQKGRVSLKEKRWGSWALPPGKESGWAVPHELKKNWDLRLGKSGELLPSLVKEVPWVDLFLYDVPYEIEEAKQEFAIVNQKLRKGSVALADNCLEPITWWANKRGVEVYRRKNSGLRGFRVS
jgi:Methyltransferase domain